MPSKYATMSNDENMYVIASEGPISDCLLITGDTGGSRRRNVGGTVVGTTRVLPA